jgi:hypothetical protein
MRNPEPSSCARKRSLKTPLSSSSPPPLREKERERHGKARAFRERE